MKYLPLLALILIGCGHNPKLRNEIAVLYKDTVPFAKFPYIASECNIDRLVSRIDSSDCVYFGRIGYAGEESMVYDTYLRLLQIAPDSIWLRLSFSKNPVLRVYAFEALESQKSKYLQVVKNRLRKDKATICYVSADIRIIYSISSLVSSGN